MDAPRLNAHIRQVCETPEFKGFIQPFNLWSKRCLKCGHTNRGRMPEGAPKGAFGPRLQAQISVLSGRFRMTRREIISLHKALFRIPISLGSVQACCRAVSEASAETAQAIHAEVKQARIRIWAENSLLNLQIEDGGKGFDANASLASAQTAGLSGILERVALLDGDVLIESTPGHGTRISARLPVIIAHQESFQ